MWAAAKHHDRHRQNVLDWRHSEWHAKPVGFVSCGGLAGGLHAVAQPRVAFAELHATTIRRTVSFHNVWEQLDAGGRLLASRAADEAAAALFAQPAWWPGPCGRPGPPALTAPEGGAPGRARRPGQACAPP